MAIENELSIYYPAAKFSFEYMDTKKQAPTKMRLEELKNLYKVRYNDRHFDVIICSDDDAFQFLLNNRDRLFSSTPVVFCGVNFFEDEMLAGKHGFTGVVEAFDLPSTISLMLKLHPETKQIVIVNDRTTTGKANREIMNQTLPGFSQTVSFVVWENMTAEELQRNASTLQEGSLILLLNYNRDREGRVLTHEESAWTLRIASSVPIYGTRDVYMGFGVLGGVITTGPVQGRLAADLAQRILRGEPADSIQVIKKLPNSYIFDMQELRRFNIPLTCLPPESEFVNQPLHSRVDFSARNLSGLDLSRADLNLSNLQGSDLRGTNLSQSSLVQALICNAKLIGANLSGAFMSAVDLHGSDLSHADLRGAYLPINYLIYSNLTGADLSGSYMDQDMVDNSTLVGARLNGASLSAVKISYANLGRALDRLKSILDMPQLSYSGDSKWVRR
jgi:uncharacterized protein YjbI with pentapeptide repeats